MTYASLTNKLLISGSVAKTGQTVLVQPRGYVNLRKSKLQGNPEYGRAGAHIEYGKLSMLQHKILAVLARGLRPSSIFYSQVSCALFQANHSESDMACIV